MSSPDPGDVNTHVRNICAKLQARDRPGISSVGDLRENVAGRPWPCRPNHRDPV